MDFKKELYRDWLGAFAAIGTPAISRDTAARILAVLYVHGNNEAFVLNKKFQQDITHIKQMYHIDGSEIPDPEIAILLKRYIKELEDYEAEHRNGPTESGAIFHSPVPDWAMTLFKERYDIKIIN